MKTKIICYQSDGSPKSIVKNIINIDSLEFNETVNGGQGDFDLQLNIPFDSIKYEVGDFIQYIITDENFKNGLFKYAGVIRGIERSFSVTRGQQVTLRVEGLVSLLSDYKINKTYSGTLKAVIDDFINDFHNNKNITQNIPFFGNTLLKNNIKSTENINMPVDDNFLGALQKIFGENKQFFINQKGEINLVSENTKEAIFTVNKNIEEIYIDEEGEIIINLVDVRKDLSIGDKIRIQNINKNLNLSGKRIQEIAFNNDLIVVNAGKIQNYKKVLK